MTINGHMNDHKSGINMNLNLPIAQKIRPIGRIKHIIFCRLAIFCYFCGKM